MKRHGVSTPALVLFLVFALTAVTFSSTGLTDPDFHWHLAYGQWILDHGALPAADMWSWTALDEPYRLTQWLGETLIGLAWSADGMNGTAMLAAVLVAGTMAASYRAALIYLPNKLGALAVAVLFCSILMSTPCRPQQFTFLLLAIESWLIAAFIARGSRSIWFLPPFMVLWVNLHGAYVIGILVLGMWTALIATQAYISHDKQLIRSKALPMAVVLITSIAATLINPYGVGAWGYATEIAQLRSSSMIQEWSATSIKTEIGLQFFMVTATVFAAMAFGRRKPSMATVLAALAIAGLGWSAERLSLMSCVILVPIAAQCLRDTPIYDLIFENAKVSAASKVPTTAAVVIAAAAVAYMAFVPRATPHDLERYAQVMPVEEAAFMRNESLTDMKLLNPPEVGGYLIREAGVRVSIDTRLDLYGDDRFFANMHARVGDASWKDFVRASEPELVLLKNREPLRQLLIESANYRLVFEGDTFSVLIKSSYRPDLPTLQPTTALTRVAAAQ